MQVSRRMRNWVNEMYRVVQSIRAQSKKLRRGEQPNKRQKIKFTTTIKLQSQSSGTALSFNFQTHPTEKVQGPFVKLDAIFNS